MREIRHSIRKQEQEKNQFFNLFIQISGRIWTVVGRGYFSHASSYRKNVASARRVTLKWRYPIILRKPQGVQPYIV